MVHPVNMKRIIFVLVAFQVFQHNLGQNDNITSEEVEQYVEDIQNLEAQTLNWSFETNSLSYLLPSFNNELLFEGDYDFVIIGSGSAGSVLANRLSEISSWKILLLEAGGWENQTSDIPDMTDNLRCSNFNWGYNITSQGSNLAGYIDHAFSFPRGKAIGGTSVINAMIYARGNKADFDKWGAENPGWSYEDILPYFKKSEKVSFPGASPVYHGTNGTLHVEYSRIYDQIGKAFLEAQVELNRTVQNDYNGLNQMAFSIVQLNEVEGRRDSGGKAFINPAKNRNNLKIVTDALVTKLLIHENNKTVYGVEYVKEGNLYYATAKKEVLLSAGTINSVQILMLSGIGPQDHLNDLGIKVIQDLPVGNNLWDHIIYTFQSFSINYTYVTKDVTTQVEEYLRAEGPLTTADDLQCIGYVNLMNTSTTVPDIEHVLHTSTPGFKPYTAYKNINRLTEASYETVIKPTFDKSQISIHSVLLHPKSRGTIRLKSSSPFDYPLLNSNYFSDPRDADTLVASLKDQVKIANTPAMQRYNASLIKVCHPACNCSEFGSDEFLLCMVKAMTNTVFHYSGTAKMGPKNDTTAVVDAALKVHGVNNLRVVDCSVIPYTTSGHTNAVAYLIGEKAADLIKNKYCKGNNCNSQ